MFKNLPAASLAYFFAMRPFARLVSIRRQIKWFVAMAFLFAGSVSGMDLVKLDESVVQTMRAHQLAITATESHTLEASSNYLPLRNGVDYFRNQDNQVGSTVTEASTIWVDHHPFGPLWRVTVTPTELDLLRVMPDGGLFLVGSEDREHGVLTHYEPAIPVLPKGLRVGEERRLNVRVTVHDLADAKELRETGALTVHLKYLGGFRLTSDTGEYDVIATKSSIDGEIGPANIRGKLVRFYGVGKGLVLETEEREVSAFLVYDEHLRRTRVRLPGNARSRVN